MKLINIRALFCTAALCLAGCGQSKYEYDVLTHVRQLKPGMTTEDVNSIFPHEMLWQDEPVDESKVFCWMMRCYSTNLVTRKIIFQEPKFPQFVDVYFDSNDKLVGINTWGTGDMSLKPNELRFPGELPFPSKFAGGDSAYPELYRKAMPGSATNQP